MSDYIVSARKYRPATFRSVVGQKNLTSTLKNSIESGRLAQAYLFCGPRGVGKTSCARIFAKTINCLSPDAEGEACGQCASCKAIEMGNSFNLVELDAASNNSVDDIRQVTEQVNIPPQVGRYRVFIIDEVHMLSTQAFNAFLKTLEEPPAYAVFILATTEKHKVIPTILSRCQIYDFKRITIDDMAEHLAYVASCEGIEADPKALGVIARKADGAMRDALSIFDQVAASTRGKMTYQAVTENLNVLDYDYFFRLVEGFATGNVPEALLLYKEVRDKGFDSLFFVNSLAQHIRDLMVAADARTVSLLETPADVSERLVKQSGALPLPWYYSAMRILNECDFNYRTAGNKQLLVELTLIRLCQLLAPATPPFDNTDREIPLRDPAGTAPRSAAPQSAGTIPEPAAPYEPEPAASVTPPPATTAEAEQPLQTTTQKVRPRTFRLSAAKHTPDVSIEPSREPFTDAQFFEAWNRFVAENPDQHILASAMREARPVRSGEFEFSVMVKHPAEQQAFELSTGRILEFLRHELHNELLTIHVEISPESDAEKPLPPQELLKKVITDNPALGEFLCSIDAELA